MADKGELNKDIGLLILRIGLGGMFIYHGLPKMAAGPEMWEKLGHAVGNFGITFAPVFWGFMAAFAELFGGLFLMLGILPRTFCILLTIDMLVASTMHLAKGDGLAVAAHAIEVGIVFLGLVFIGAGRFSLAGKNRFLSEF